MKVRIILAAAIALCVLVLSLPGHAARLKYPFTPEKLEVMPGERLLVVAPHPDDEAIGAGGLLALYGSQCDVLVLTDGAKGHKGLPEEVKREVRRLQFLAEMELVKPNGYFGAEKPVTIPSVPEEKEGANDLLTIDAVVDLPESEGAHEFPKVEER